MKNKRPVVLLIHRSRDPPRVCAVLINSDEQVEKTGDNKSSQRCAAIHNQICIYKTYLDDNTFCCAITQLLNIKGERRREHLLGISRAPTNLTMGKVSLLNIVVGNVQWKIVFF